MSFENLYTAEKTALYHEYACFTDTTARYPVAFEKPYLALGLCDETSFELAVALERGNIDDAFWELGDAHWYLCRLALSFEFDYKDIIAEAKGLYGRAKPLGEGPDQCADQLTKKAGEIAGRVKKYIRDGDSFDLVKMSDFKTHLRALMVEYVMVTFSMLDAMWKKEPSTGNFDAMLKANVKKLGGRLARGTIHGDGDHR